MQAESVSDYKDFYVDARRSLEAGVYDQDVEDAIDTWMRQINEEDEEIEELFVDEEVSAVERPKMEVIPSEFTEFAIRIPIAGDLEPFSFADRRYLKPVYDTPARRTLLKCARQTEKSTSLGNKSLAYCGINYGFKVLYVSATATQAQVFSVDRIKEPLDISPELCFLVDTKLNQNVLFKQFKNRSQIRIRYAFLNADRCLHGDSRVQMADGTLRLIRDLAEAGGTHSVVAAQEDGKPVLATARLAHRSGVKKIVRVHTDYPTDLVCSNDHPLKTGRGWVRADELKSSDFIAAPHSAGLFQHESIGEDWAWLIGAMLAEGECSKRTSVRFTNSDEDYLGEFIRRARRVGIRIGDKVEDRRNGYKTCWSIGLYSDTNGPGLDGAKLRLWELGEFGDKADKKHIPQAIWKATPEEKTAFLWALFCGDGWCAPDRGGARAGYSSSSKRLVEDLAHMLWSFGVRSSIRQRPPSTKNAKPSWTLSLSKYPTRKLIELIGPFRDCPVEHTGKKDDQDRIPLTYAQLREHLTKRHGLNSNQAWAQYHIQLSPGGNRDSVGRRVLLDIAGKLNDPELSVQASDDCSWVRVRGVEEVGQGDVYDMTVDKYHCFMADGLIVSNTRGIPADMILIDEFQDILFANVPVIEQCASHSYWKIYCYSGTPKSLDNSIEVYWSNYSTQNEWMVPCDRHGKSKYPQTWFWNNLGIKNIGKKGLICAKCGHPISAMHPYANWASKQPVTEGNAHRVTFEGYRIHQLMVPWISWQDDVIMALERYGTAKFYNEVLGLSYDSGVRPLTRTQVRSCCQSRIKLSDVIENAAKCHSGVFAGIDWGCHDDQTRILTDSGFKLFRDLTDEDLVAQFDKDTRLMSFVKPEVRTVRDWDDPLYHVTGKGIDMMLTGTHRMLVKPDGHRDWHVEPVSEFAGRRADAKIRGWVDWHGEEITSFTLSGLPVSSGYSGSEPLEIEADLWLELLGYWLSEGGLCFNDDGRPSCVKMSQRVVRGDESRVSKIMSCLERSGLNFSKFYNAKTGDVNWTIYGKQVWNWWLNNIGSSGDSKRIPRQFLSLSKRQLRILFDAMMLGDGTEDQREDNDNGGYYSTSHGLCEDFQELCIRLGLKSTVRLHQPAEGNRKDRYRTSWSGTRDLHLNYKAMQRIERVSYSGKVYCCKVPSGFIVTERNGCVAYQGNTGEQDSYTVIALGGYMGGEFQIFYVHRFTGEDLEPQRQLQMIVTLLNAASFKLIGADYGGGFDRNDFLQRNFGPLRLAKYQYAGSPKAKVRWQSKLGRFILHRTEIMSDIFNALKYKKIYLPNWEEFSTPHADDMLNIFSEYNDQLNMIQYKLSPGKSDDTFHAILYCFLASMLLKPRPDIIIPLHAGHVDFNRR